MDAGWYRGAAAVKSNVPDCYTREMVEKRRRRKWTRRMAQVNTGRSELMVKKENSMVKKNETRHFFAITGIFNCCAVVANHSRGKTTPEYCSLRHHSHSASIHSWWHDNTHCIYCILVRPTWYTYVASRKGKTAQYHGSLPIMSLSPEPNISRRT